MWVTMCLFGYTRPGSIRASVAYLRRVTKEESRSDPSRRVISSVLVAAVATGWSGYQATRWGGWPAPSPAHRSSASGSDLLELTSDLSEQVQRMIDLHDGPTRPRRPPLACAACASASRDAPVVASLIGQASRRVPRLDLFLRSQESDPLLARGRSHRHDPYHALVSATSRNPRQQFRLEFPLSAPGRFANACHQLQHGAP